MAEGFYAGAGLGLTQIEDEDQDGATVGAGIRWGTSETFAVRGEFEWYDTDLDTLWSVGVGFQYFFGK